MPPAMNIPPLDQDPAEVADAVLGSALALQTGVVRVLPGSERGYQVRCEAGGEAVAVAEIDGRVGAAAVLRLVAVGGLDPVSFETQVGRVRVRCGPDLSDIVVCSLATDLGPAVDLLVLGRTSPSPKTPVPEELEPGALVGPYRVVERIGFGGMGAVYRIEHLQLGRMFALKVMHRDLFDDAPESVEHFVREGRAAARVKHSGVVDVSDCGFLEDGRPYLVMELLSGACLEDLIADKGALQPERAVSLLAEIARALQAAHSSGVLHRDISTANVFVESDEHGERVKLIDFGAAAVDEADADRERPPAETIVGTPCFISPEQVRGRPADARSDIYSLGVVFYELLTGALPFMGDAVQDILLQHLSKPPPPPQSPFGKLPRRTRRILDRMLAKDPSDRYQSLVELLEDLGEPNSEGDLSRWWKPAHTSR